MSRKKINWDEIERKYIYSKDKIPYRILAEEYGLSPVTVGNRGMKGKWVEKREEVQSRLKATAFESKLTEEIIGEQDIGESAQISARILLDSILKISNRILTPEFLLELNEVKAERLLNSLSSLANSLERVLRTVSLLNGGASNRIEYTLVDILSEMQET